MYVNISVERKVKIIIINSKSNKKLKSSTKAKQSTFCQP